jgi:hypothetical protein
MMFGSAVERSRAVVPQSLAAKRGAPAPQSEQRECQGFAILVRPRFFNHSLTKAGQIINQLESPKIGEAGCRASLSNANR